MKDKINIEKEVANYYTQKVQEHGASHWGVDWNSTESQHLRFEQLCKVLPNNGEAFSVLDFGCGYGALWPYLQEKFPNQCQHFVGYDVSEAMLAEAAKLYGEQSPLQWTSQLPAPASVDYLIASGIFNVRLETDEESWKKYILESLEQYNQLTQKGFSFNVLTSYSDAEYMQSYLHYANPLELFDYCKKNFSKNVALLHDYNLYEFTILVRK